MRNFLRIFFDFLLFSLFFFVLWMSFSGLFKIKLLILGALSSVVCSFLIIKMNFKFKVSPRKAIYFIFYQIWLFKEVMISAGKVTAKIISGNFNNTNFYRMNLSVSDINYQILLAHSITLTPGTLAVKLNEKSLLIHTVLSDESELVIDKYLSKIEKN